jgi:hypothetical protein
MAQLEAIASGIGSLKLAVGARNEPSSIAKKRPYGYEPQARVDQTPISTREKGEASNMLTWNRGVPLMGSISVSFLLSSSNITVPSRKNIPGSRFSA